MQHRLIVIVGGLSFVAGAIAFVGVFSYLAVSFNYPGILDGSAAEVLPRLRAGGSTMRAAWALYAFLPLLLLPGAVGACFACPSSRGRMTLALVFTSIGSLAMCLGLIRWPSIHWVLAEAYAQSGEEARISISATFLGLNVYLGNYVGEFLGETCLAVFFFLTGMSLLDEKPYPQWLAWGSMLFAMLFAVGAFRNVLSAVQPVADINNALLPLWMAVLGVSLILQSRATSGSHD
jgi:hypothetical protein